MVGFLNRAPSDLNIKFSLLIGGISDLKRKNLNGEENDEKGGRI